MDKDITSYISYKVAGRCKHEIAGVKLQTTIGYNRLQQVTAQLQVVTGLQQVTTGYNRLLITVSYRWLR